MRTWSRPLGNGGVTLIELLVAIVIASILIGAGIPAFLTLIEGSKLNAATRKLMYEIRAAQNLAVTRGGVFGFHWGGDPFVALPVTQYRLEADPAGGCAFPAPADTMATNANVISDWFDLAGEYQGVTIQGVFDNNGTVLGGVIFNSRGASVNTCVVPAPTFPVCVYVADAAGTAQVIQVHRAGRVTIIPPPAAPGVCQ